MELVWPYATIEPVRELLLQRFMGEKFGRDTIWESHLANELWVTDVPVEAVLDEQILTLGEVMNLQVGQTLMLNTEPDGEIEMRCSGVKMMTGRMGRVGRHVAIQIEQLTNRPKHKI